MATIKYQEDEQGNKKIIVKTDPETDQQKVSCGCCDGCGLEVRSVTASLSHVGYLPFPCEGSEPPPTDTRYLKYRASGDGYIEACGVAPQHQNVTQEWEVDPFTGLTCYNGPESDIVSSGCSELQNCSATQKSYSCAFEGDPNDPCAPMEGGSVNWTESLQDSYTIEDVASNVDTVLGRINPYGNDGMPAGTRGSVVNGTNGSILTWVNECALNRAEYISGAGGVTKTKLFVKFTKDTQYTLTQSNGSVQTLTATEGQQIIVETPSEQNTWTDIAIVNKTKVGCCNSSIGATTHTGEATDASRPWWNRYFVGPDCKPYSKVTTVNNSIIFRTLNEQFSNPTGSSNQTYNRNFESEKVEKNYAPDEYNSTETWVWQKSAQSEMEEFFAGDSESSSVTYSNINGVESYTGSQSYTNTCCSWDEEPTTDTYSGTCNSLGTCSQYYPSALYGCGTYTPICPIVTDTTITTGWSASGSCNDSEGTSWTNSETHSQIVTFSEPYNNQEWEEETSLNETFCASHTEELTPNWNIKYTKNVAASVELTFTAPASESPINYEHWFHYYTVEVDSSEQGCPTSDVVAHNEKWTSVSSGGVLTLSRNINLSTPPKDHSICAQSLAFVTRVAS
jgi:hypothetical protein